MSLKIELGPTSQTAIELPIDYSSTFGKKQLRSQHRTLGGNLYLYKYSDFIKHRFKVDFISNENASIVNSWWENNTELLLFVSSGSGLPDAEIDYSEVFSDYTFTEVTRGVNSLDYVKLTESVNSAQHYVYEHINVEQNTDLYFDAKLKESGKNRVGIYMYDGFSYPYLRIYLNSGSHFNPNSDDVFYTKITSEAGDFWRIAIGFRVTDTTSVRAMIYLINSNDSTAYDGDGVSGIWAGDVTLKGVVVDTEVHSVMILNAETPLNKFSKPYHNYYDGKLDLESY